ncbi:D-glucuronyl C5-epimerase family protein [Micromonospora mangrovi]|uniref:D-glucuronyl C5-epimerase family protein n=2 Tax=Micromonospora TaxID=1873 RepID=A0AAU8HP12_9ACTN
MRHHDPLRPDGHTPPLTRRAVVAGCLAAGAVPLLGGGPARAVVGERTPAPAGAPGVIDPAHEISPPAHPEPLQELSAIPSRDRARLAPHPPSTPGAGRVGGPVRTYAGSTSVPFQFRYDDFEIRELPLGIEPYHLSSPVPLVDSGVHDATGVRMTLLGGKLYDHPVAQAQYGLNLLESHRITGDQAYLDRARLQAQRLVDRRVLRAGAWFYPYRFNYQLHARYDVHTAPWYSMMAQGQALSLFTRLHQRTGEAGWRAAADATFASFLLPPVAGQPWGAYVVDGLLWLEEYPHPTQVRGDRTYNGHMFSAYGLYDYWVLTRDANAKLLLQGAITTYRDVRDLIRVRQWRSRYCLTHGIDAGQYHMTHMFQFLQQYAITGDTFLAQLGDLWYADYPPLGVKGTVRFSAGSHTGYKFSSSGAVLASYTLRLGKSSAAPSVDRRKVMRQTGIWYAISAGTLSGYLVRESTPTRYQVGSYAGVGYKLHRPGTVAVAAPPAYAIDSAGGMSAVPTTYRVGDPVALDGRAVLNGVEHVRLVEGPYAGRWLGLGAVIRG